MKGMDINIFYEYTKIGIKAISARVNLNMNMNMKCKPSSRRGRQLLFFTRTKTIIE